jgi:catechol 2,3-dioxygenase-like lactoylglutathione lyase family enzyme
MAGRQGQGESRQAVLLLAAVLGLGALVLIVVIAGHSRPEGAEARLIPIALALALVGPSGAAGLFLAERRPRLAPLGYLTAALGLFAFVVIAIHVVSGDLYLGGDWHLQGVALALALATGQISLVAACGRDDDGPPLRLLTAGTALAILLFGIFAAYETADGGSQVSVKTFGILATLYLLGICLLVLFRGTSWLERRGRVDGSLGLDHVVIAVSDRSRSIPFYTALLGAEVVERPGGRIAFRVGGQLLNVHEPGIDVAPVARDRVRPGNSDLCFVWPAAAELAVAMVHELGAELVEGPVPRDGAAGAGRSVYTRDPDGSLIELISYV